MRTATAIWWVSPELVLALDEHLGPPVDSYLNGSQTWFGGDERTIEWRLHPVGAYRAPAGCSHYDLWEQVVAQLSAGVNPERLTLGSESRALAGLWDGLEAFPAYDDEYEPATLAQVTVELLGIAPDLSGVVDHEPVGEAWERSHGEVSIIRLLADQLQV
ncbi:MAG: hypothetical protein FJW88_04975 [Actinobacteria bacterium]|nr:hypothetical protein [Actinomycetota bacterium]